MSKIVKYELKKSADGERWEGRTLHDDPNYADVSTSCVTDQYSEQEALWKFQDACTEFYRGENALIFITKEQAKAMEDYDEMEKHGG